MDASMRSRRTLEVTVISAENLSVDGTPVVDNVYVVVRTESITSFTTSMSTTAESGGSGSNPSWNETFLVDMPMHARSITFEVKCRTEMRVKNVGVARIAVSDFLGGSEQENCSQVLSYRLRDWEGRRNGVIHFTVKMSDNYSSIVEPAKGIAVAKMTEKVNSCGFQMRGNNFNGVVTGVPVCWINNYTRSNF